MEMCLTLYGYIKDQLILVNQLVIQLNQLFNTTYIMVPHAHQTCILNVTFSISINEWVRDI